MGFSPLVIKIIIGLQLFILVATCLFVGTPFLWVWAIASFFPVLAICLYVSEKKYVLFSILLLFISQQAIFIFVNPTWGFSYGSDPINDYHVTLEIYEKSQFEVGHIEYAGRSGYSYYPLVHLFSVVISKISGVSLMSIALYLVPISSTIITGISIYHLNHALFGLEGRERNVATLFFELSFYYTSMDSQFVRETFAFPLTLLLFWVFTKIANSKDREYTILAPILIVAVTLSHQTTSYLALIILIIMAASLSVFKHNKRLNMWVLLTVAILGAYTSFVALSFSATQWTYAFEGIQAVFNRESTHTIMKSYSSTSLYLSYIHYAVLGTLGIIGGITLLRSRKKDRMILSLIGFFVMVFILSMILRLSTSADAWSWTYYMALRGTIWAFLGISIIVAIGIVYLLKLNRINRRVFLLSVFLVSVLAAGKFSQYALLVIDSSKAPLGLPHYDTALWLRENVANGSRILVAPYRVDIDAFETSRDMTPYAYLKEYFLDDTKGVYYDDFRGYVPFVGAFFDQYRNSSQVQIIFSNYYADIGYKR